MLDKKNPYTSFGQMLVSAGILNLVARFNIIIDLVISLLLIGKGGMLIRNRKWQNDEKWNRIICLTGMVYPLVKLPLIYFFSAERVVTASDKVISKADVMFSSSVFLIPAAVISLIAFRKLSRIERGDF